MTAARVGVPVAVVYGGIAAIIGLLFAVGFFAGRASSGSGGPEATAAEGLPADRIADLPAEAPVDVAPLPDALATADALAAQSGGAVAPMVASASSPPSGPGGAPAPSPLRREVAEYFRQMEVTQSAAKTWSDPTALAQEVLADALRGDSGGFDRLIAASVGARDGVRTMTVPAPCVEHHRLTLALLGEAVVILTRLREGVAAGDAGAVAGIASSGSALEGRARAVDALGASLKSQFGVEGAR